MTWVPTRVGCSVFLNNRYQDPITGLFLSVDPLVSETGQAYLYASGNPTMLSDPSGLEPGCGATATSSASCSSAHTAASSMSARNSARHTLEASNFDLVNTTFNHCVSAWGSCQSSYASQLAGDHSDPAMLRTMGLVIALIQAGLASGQLYATGTGTFDNIVSNDAAYFGISASASERGLLMASIISFDARETNGPNGFDLAGLAVDAAAAGAVGACAFGAAPACAAAPWLTGAGLALDAVAWMSDCLDGNCLGSSLGELGMDTAMFGLGKAGSAVLSSGYLALSPAMIADLTRMGRLYDAVQGLGVSVAQVNQAFESGGITFMPRSVTSGVMSLG